MKDIPEYEGLYGVTEDGKVWSYRREIWMKPYVDRKGYFQIMLTKDKVQRCFRVHRLVANTYLAPVEDKEIVNHKNGIRTDNRVENLEWCTLRENILHGIYVLGNRYGEKNPNYRNGRYVVGRII